MSAVRKLLNRLRDELISCFSVNLARIAFQARFFNHSDISPFRINSLQRSWDQSIARLPFSSRNPVRITVRHPALYT